jgi:hypothetical protein
MRPERRRRLKFGKRARDRFRLPQAEQSPTKQEWSARTGCAVAAESTSASANTRVFMDGPPLRGSLLASHAKSYRGSLIDPIAEVFRRFPELSSSFRWSVEDVGGRASAARAPINDQRHRDWLDQGREVRLVRRAARLPRRAQCENSGTATCRNGGRAALMRLFVAAMRSPHLMIFPSTRLSMPGHQQSVPTFVGFSAGQVIVSAAHCLPRGSGLRFGGPPNGRSTDCFGLLTSVVRGLVSCATTATLQAASAQGINSPARTLRRHIIVRSPSSS